MKIYTTTKESLVKKLVDCGFEFEKIEQEVFGIKTVIYVFEDTRKLRAAIYSK